MAEMAPDKASIHPAVMVGLGGALLLNITLLMSLPPVIRGKGAPYLPTTKGRIDTTFAALHTHFAPQLSEGKKLLFADLGSGDGRVVFRAAREEIFMKSVGYEINPCK
jgi:hypothetical protein